MATMVLADLLQNVPAWSAGVPLVDALTWGFGIFVVFSLGFVLASFVPMDRKHERIDGAARYTYILIIADQIMIAPIAFAPYYLSGWSEDYKAAEWDDPAFPNRFFEGLWFLWLLGHLTKDVWIMDSTFIEAWAHHIVTSITVATVLYARPKGFAHFIMGTTYLETSNVMLYNSTRLLCPLNVPANIAYNIGFAVSHAFACWEAWAMLSVCGEGLWNATLALNVVSWLIILGRQHAAWQALKRAMAHSDARNDDKSR